MHLILIELEGAFILDNDAVGFAQSISEVLGVEDFETNWDRYQFQTQSGILQEISQRYRQRPVSSEEMSELDEVLIQQMTKASSTEVSLVCGSVEFLEKLLSAPHFTVALVSTSSEKVARAKMSQAQLELGDLPLASSSESVVREHIMLMAMDKAAQQQRSHFAEVTLFAANPASASASHNLGWNLVGIGSQIEVPRRFEDYRNAQEIIATL